MSESYFYYQDSYLSAFKALNIALDVSPLDSYTNARDTISKDLKRIRFYSDLMSFQDYCEDILNNLAFERTYLQGDLDAGLIAKHLIMQSPLEKELHVREQTLKKELQKEADDTRYNCLIKQQEELEQTLDEIYRCDNVGLRLAYITDAREFNGLSIVYLESNPELFSIAIIEKTNRPLQERRVHLWGSSLFLPKATKLTGPFSEIEPTELKLKLSKHIKNETLSSLLQNVITIEEGGARVNQKTIKLFKRHYLDAGNYGDLEELVSQKTTQNSRFEKKKELLKILIKSALSNKEQQRVQNKISNTVAFDKLVFELDELNKTLSKEMRDLLNTYAKTRASQLKNHKIKLRRHKRTYPDVAFLLNKSFLTRYCQEIIAITLSSCLSVISATLLLTLSLSPLSIPYLTLSSLLFLSGITLVTSSHSFFKKHHPLKQYLKGQRELEQSLTDQLTELETETIEQLSTHNLELTRVKLLELLASKNLEQPTKIIEHFHPS